MQADERNGQKQFDSVVLADLFSNGTNDAHLVGSWTVLRLRYPCQQSR